MRASVLIVVGVLLKRPDITSGLIAGIGIADTTAMGQFTVTAEAIAALAAEP